MPKYLLRTLGTVALEGPGGPLAGPAAQRKRLALLALLVAAGDRGTTREKLLACLWPETDEERGRHVLAQSLYALRKDTGADDLFLGTDPIRVNTDVLGSDAVALEAAVRDGRPEEALALYGGPFMDGFHLAGAPELERWMDGERDRLARLARSAAASLAAAAREAGDAAASVHWSRRHVTLDPLDAAATITYMRALAAAGEPATALRHGRVHEALVRDELGAPASAEVRALTARLQTEQYRPTPVPPAPPPPGERVAPPVMVDIAPPPHAPDGSPDAMAPSARPLLPAMPRSSAGGVGVHDGRTSRATRASRALRALRTTHRRWRIGAVVVAAGLATALAVVAMPRVRTAAVAAAATDGAAAGGRVVVLPFSVRGAADHAYLGDGMVDLLAASLDGTDGLRSVDARSVFAAVGLERAAGPSGLEARVATRLRASLYVDGSVAAAGDGVRVDATLHDIRDPSRALARASLSGPSSELFALVDGLTARLVAARRPGAQGRLDRLATATTHSLPALRAYLDGERAFRRQHLDAAVDAFQQAVAHDSSFALAWYRLALVASWYVQPALADSAAQRAVRLSDRLPARERQLAEGLRSFVSGDADRAERAYRAVLSQHPDDPEAWLGLGEVLFHHDWARDRSLVESRFAWTRVLAADPADWTARFHLAQVAAFERRPREVDTLVRHLVGTDTLLLLNASPLLLRAAVVGDTVAARAALQRLAGAAHGWVMVAAKDVAIHSRDLRAAERITRILSDRVHRPALRALAHATLASLAAADGRWDDARTALVAARAEERDGALAHRAVLMLMAGAPTGRGDLLALRAELAAWRTDIVLPDAQAGSWTIVHDGVQPLIREYLLALADLRLGDTAVAAVTLTTRAAAIEQASVPLSPAARMLAADLARELRAELASARGDDAAALAIAGSMAPAVPFERAWASPLWSRASLRLLRVRLLLRTGSPREAGLVAAGFAENSIYDLPFGAMARASRQR